MMLPLVMKMNGGNNYFSQGGIYLAHLNSNKGTEIGKIRPVCILTNQKILDLEPPLVFICPLSSKSYHVSGSLHVPIKKRDSINKDSYVLVEHCRSIDINRLKLPRLGQLNKSEILEINKLVTLMIEV